jgi:hypothetical protein
MIRTLLLAAALLLVAAGCGDTMSRGIVITGDGKMGANNARNQRESAQDVLRIAIEDDLGKGWTIRVTVDELPIWVEDRNIHQGDSGSEGMWRWEKLTTAIEITPPMGQQLSEAKQAEYIADARKHLLGKLVKKDPALVAVSLKVNAAMAVAAAPVPQVAGQRTYVVQSGDTLADLSMAFYGGPQHWRLIAEANPNGLAPGQTVVIPALPAAPAPAKP